MNSKAILGLMLIITFLVGVGIGLLTAIIYYNTDKDTVSPTPMLTPTPGELSTCTYEGKVYRSGEGFPSSDGCNTCTCINGEVACTLMACEE